MQADRKMAPLPPQDVIARGIGRGRGSRGGPGARGADGGHRGRGSATKQTGGQFSSKRDEDRQELEFGSSTLEAPQIVAVPIAGPSRYPTGPEASRRSTKTLKGDFGRRPVDRAALSHPVWKGKSRSDGLYSLDDDHRQAAASRFAAPAPRVDRVTPLGGLYDRSNNSNVHESAPAPVSAQLAREPDPGSRSVQDTYPPNSRSQLPPRPTSFPPFPPPIPSQSRFPRSSLDRSTTAIHNDIASSSRPQQRHFTDPTSTSTYASRPMDPTTLTRLSQPVPPSPSITSSPNTSTQPTDPRGWRPTGPRGPTGIVCSTQSPTVRTTAHHQGPPDTAVSSENIKPPISKKFGRYPPLPPSRILARSPPLPANRAPLPSTSHPPFQSTAYATDPPSNCSTTSDAPWSRQVEPSRISDPEAKIDELEDGPTIKEESPRYSPSAPAFTQPRIYSVPMGVQLTKMMAKAPSLDAIPPNTPQAGPSNPTKDSQTHGTAINANDEHMVDELMNDVDVKPDITALQKQLDGKEDVEMSPPPKADDPWRRSGAALYRWPDMPDGCLKGRPYVKSNRQHFLIEAKVLLRNQNRIPVSAKWRDDGLAIDWNLDRTQGVYFAPWPPTVTSASDKMAMEVEVAARVRSADPQNDRKILATTRSETGVKVSWARVRDDNGNAARNYEAVESTPPLVNASTMHSRVNIPQPVSTMRRINVVAAMEAPHEVSPAAVPTPATNSTATSSRSWPLPPSPVRTTRHQQPSSVPAESSAVTTELDPSISPPRSLMDKGKGKQVIMDLEEFRDVEQPDRAEAETHSRLLAPISVEADSSDHEVNDEDDDMPLARPSRRRPAVESSSESDTDSDRVLSKRDLSRGHSSNRSLPDTRSDRSTGDIQVNAASSSTSSKRRRDESKATGLSKKRTRVASPLFGAAAPEPDDDMAVLRSKITSVYQDIAALRHVHVTSTGDAAEQMMRHITDLEKQALTMSKELLALTARPGPSPATAPAPKATKPPHNERRRLSFCATPVHAISGRYPAESLRFVCPTPDNHRVVAFSSKATVTSFTFDDESAQLKSPIRIDHRLGGGLVSDGVCVSPDKLVMTVKADSLAGEVVNGGQILVTQFGSNRGTWLLEGSPHSGDIGAVAACSYRNDGTGFQFFSGGNDHSVRLWTVGQSTDARPPCVKKTALLHNSHKAAIHTMAYNSSSRILWSGGQQVMWAYDTNDSVQRPTTTIKVEAILTHIHIDPHNPTYVLAECRQEHKQNHLFDTRDSQAIKLGRPQLSFGHDHRLTWSSSSNLTRSPPSRYCRGGFNDMLFGSGDQRGTVRIWDMRYTADPCHTIPHALPKEVMQVTLRDDGIIVSGKKNVRWYSRKATSG